MKLPFQPGLGWVTGCGEGVRIGSYAVRPCLPLQSSQIRPWRASVHDRNHGGEVTSPRFWNKAGGCAIRRFATRGVDLPTSWNMADLSESGCPDCNQ